jgi:uncharacterized protein with PQ loop repeat
MLANVAIITATVLAASALVPQVIRLLRTQNPDGVSATWAAFGIVTNATWTVYLISQALWLALPSVIMVVAGYAVTFVLLYRLGVRTGTPISLGIGWICTLAAVGAVGGWTGLGTLLGFSYAVQVAPGIWTAYRTHRPAGISPGTWWILLIEGLLWGYYGWWNADTPLMIFAVVATLASIAMLGRYGATRHRLPAEELTAPVAA